MKEAKAIGRANAPYLFVMTSPPSEGMEAWFWKALLAAGIKKTEVRIVFLIDEPPAGSGNKPLVSQLRSAAPRFRREMSKSTPKVCVPLGGPAFYACTGITEKIFTARGYVIRKDLFRPVPTEVFREVGKYKQASKATGAKKGDPRMKWVKEAQAGALGAKFKGVVIPTFTLEHIQLNGFSIKPAFREDILRARRVVDGTLVEIDRDFSYYTDLHQGDGDKGRHLRKLGLNHVKWGEIIAVDIETHGIDNEVIDLVSFSDGQTTAVLDWSEDARVYVEKLFALPGRTFIIHNSQFDLPRLIANGVHIAQHVIDRQVFCSMFGAVTIQPDLYKGLGSAATVYVDCGPWKWEELKTLRGAKYYAAKDAFITAWLGIQEIAVMKKLGCWNLFMGQGGHPGPGVMETLPEIEAMTRGGIRTNKPYATTWCARLERHQLRLEKMWSKLFPNVRPSSNPQVSKLFYAEWGLPVQRTEEDGVSVDELALVKLGTFVEQQRGSELFPGDWRSDPRCTKRIFDLLLVIRRVSKILSTYVQPVMLGEDTWVHPYYLPTSKDDERGGKKMSSKGNTATGRFVAYKPNIQNQPKSTRVLYVPDRDDMCFLQHDYKSAELYVLAGMSGDMQLLDDLQHDMHQRNADRLGISRKVAKNVTYASQYLASPAKQSSMILEQEHMWVSPADCLVISQGIWGTYTDATAYKNHIVDLCARQRYIVNPFGRVRFFNDGRAPAAVDFIPQSTVADILWCVLKSVAQIARKYGGRLVTTVHDSILTCVPYENREAAALEIKAAMEKRFDCVRKGFYIPVEIEMGAPGASWGHLKKWELAEAA